MNQSTKPVFLVIFACVFGTTYAATLFQDNFQDSVATKANWIFPAAVKRQFTGGVLGIQCADSVYMWYVTHNFSTKAPTFTLSATITLPSSDVNGAGLGFCMTGSDGITLWLGPGQNMYAYKGSVLLFNAVNSFINTTVNTVKISKKDSVFNVFCNGTYVTRFVCSESKYVAGGDIAVAVPTKSSFQIDDIIMTDQFETGAPITFYNNNFSSGNTQGWYTSSIIGTASVASGSFTIANDGTSPATPYISGNFNKASLRAIVTHKQGAGYYGLAFFDFAPGPVGDTVKAYLFLVDSTREFASGLPDSSSIAALQTSIVHGDTDTLMVLRFSNKYKYSINGTLMSDSFPLLAPGRIDAAGLYIGGKTTVSFQEFAIGGDSTGIFSSIINSPRGYANNYLPLSRIMGNDFTVFDVRGRIIKHGNGNYLEAMKNLPGGMYIMKSVRNKMAVPEKCFTNVK
jgi:hypothetical protein